MSTVPNPICRKCGSARVWQKNRYRCRVCLTRTQAARKASMPTEQANFEARRANELRARRRQEDPAYREKEYGYVRAWRLANPEKYHASARGWYWKNPEARRTEKLAEYYANPAPFLARNFLRKARLLEAVCAHGPECVTDTFLTVLYSSVCVYCGDPAAEADHFYPLSRGGLHCVDNLVPACLPCNRSKHAADPFVWLASR